MTAAPETPPSSPPSSIDHVNVIGGSGFIGTRLCERFTREGGPAFTIIDKVASRRFPENSVIRDIRDAGRGREFHEAVPRAAHHGSLPAAA
jgi:nucleoside-diphosphate-sugar epimerase